METSIPESLRDVVGQLMSLGVQRGDSVLAWAEHRSTLRTAVDAARLVGCAVVVPAGALDHRSLERVSLAMNAAALVTDRAVPPGLSSWPPPVTVSIGRPDTDRPTPTADGCQPGWGVSGEHRWILHAIPDCRTWVWSQTPTAWHVDPDSTVGHPRWITKEASPHAQ
jgi:hypothetical protein